MCVYIVFDFHHKIHKFNKKIRKIQFKYAGGPFFDPDQYTMAWSMGANTLWIRIKIIGFSNMFFCKYCEQTLEAVFYQAGFGSSFIF